MNEDPIVKGGQGHSDQEIENCGIQLMWMIPILIGIAIYTFIKYS